MAQAMRSASVGTQSRAVSSGRRSAAPRVAISARAQQQQQQHLARASPVAPAAAVASRPSARVAASATAQQASPAQQTAGTGEWYALVANAEFYCNDPQNESLAEQLRERVRYFKEQNREIDFYLVSNPKWLDEKYPAQGKQVKRPCMALVSTDKQWITFMKLRLDRVLRIDLAGMPTEEALAAGEALPEFKKLDKWTAPYPMYTPGWWKVFYPQGAN